MENVEKLQSFEPDILLGRCLNPAVVMRELIGRNPEILYYIKSYSFIGRDGQYSLHVEYQNQDFSKHLVFALKESQVENFLREAVMNYVKKIVLVLPKTANFSWILNCFWKQSISFYPNVKSNRSTSSCFDQLGYTVYEVSFEYRIGTVKLKQMNAEVDQKIADLKCQLFPIAMPDSVKCLIAHNYLATTIEYFKVDESNPLEKSYVQSAYGALIRGKCVCQGYAEAYKRILDAVGISCDLISGRVLGSDGGWHAWNIIHLNQNRLHMHVDVTWDSHKKRSSTTYFGKSDAFFLNKREWDRFYYTPCGDGNQLLQEAKEFCHAHRKELLDHGLRKEWIDG